MQAAISEDRSIHRAELGKSLQWLMWYFRHIADTSMNLVIIIFTSLTWSDLVFVQLTFCSEDKLEQHPTNHVKALTIHTCLRLQEHTYLHVPFLTHKNGVKKLKAIFTEQIKQTNTCLTAFFSTTWVSWHQKVTRRPVSVDRTVRRQGQVVEVNVG